MLCLTILTLAAPARAGSYAVSFSGGSYDYDGFGDTTRDYDDGGGDYFTFDPDDPFGGVFGTDSAFTVTCTWVPDGPGDAPPQYVVLDEEGYAYYESNGSTLDGTCSDGLGDPPVAGVNGVAYATSGVMPGTPASIDHYSVHAGGASFTFERTATVSDGGDADCYMYYSVGVDPIAIAPVTDANNNVIFSPLGRPDLGDGSNQYVYTDDSPDGYLYVPGAYQAVGGGGGAQQWLLDNSIGDLKIENSIIPNTFSHLWANTGASVAINTPNNGYPSYQANRWIFKGLPAQNNQFGTHDVNLYVQGSEVQTAKIQTFFPQGGQNFPECDPSYDVNWYHYYNLIYPSPDDDPADRLDSAFDDTSDDYGYCEWDDPVDYNPTQTYGYGIGGWTATVHIGSSGGDETELPIFDLGGPNGQVRYIGDLVVRGIQTYILTCAHEQAHKSLVQMGICYPPGAIVPYGHTDNDGDGVVDDWETQHHLDPTKSDTTGVFTDKYEGFGDTGDKECLCEILAFQALLNNKDYWKQDWSDRGLQWGATTAPDFYWEFNAEVTSGEFTAGNSYNIHSLADLQAKYPTVLSDLP